MVGTADFVRRPFAFAAAGGAWYSLSMNQYHFSVVVERDGDGYVVSCPELQGCYSQGATYEEAISNIRDALVLHIADRRANGEEISTAGSVSLSTVAVTV